MKIFKKKFRLQIKVKTGLHIGSGDDKVQIGGVDSAVIKDPITKLPYIPGSSLKGKLRCLLETEGNFKDGELDETLNKYFGVNVQFKNKMEKNNEEKKKNGEDEFDYQTPTRLIFRDLTFCTDYKTKDDDGKEKTINYKDYFLKGKLTTEFKTEIVINRKKGTVKDGGLRTIERIPPEVVFEGDFIIRYLEDEKWEDIKMVLDEGLNLLQNDYLGGSGSRGYGAVSCYLNQFNKNE